MATTMTFLKELWKDCHCNTAAHVGLLFFPLVLPKMMSSRKDFKKPVQLETFGEERHSVVPYF